MSFDGLFVVLEISKQASYNQKNLLNRGNQVSSFRCCCLGGGYQAHIARSLTKSKDVDGWGKIRIIRCCVCPFQEACPNAIDTIVTDAAFAFRIPNRLVAASDLACYRHSLVSASYAAVLYELGGYPSSWILDWALLTVDLARAVTDNLLDNTTLLQIFQGLAGERAVDL